MRLPWRGAAAKIKLGSRNVFPTLDHRKTKAEKPLRVLPGELFPMQSQRIANSNAMQISATLDLH